MAGGGGGGADPFGLSAGLAQTGTGSERGHLSLKSTDSAAGGDYTEKYCLKKKIYKPAVTPIPRTLCEPELGRTQDAAAWDAGRGHTSRQVCAFVRVCV